MNKTILVTGGLGFIGSNFVDMLWSMGYDGKIIIADKMTYAARRANLSMEIGKSVKIFKVDIANAGGIDWIFETYPPALVVNFAAESHVDRSIVSSAEFVMSNIVGVQVLLDACRKHGVERFLQVSTDEVYGDLSMEDAPSREGDILKPSSPYSASKAAADLLVLSYARTHKMDVVITRCSNNYGSRQYPEKLIPLAISKIKAGLKVPVYGTGTNIRDWIYVWDHCNGVWLALQQGKSGEVYNFGGGTQIRNIDLIRELAKLMGKELDDVVEYVADRPGHDCRYAIDFSKARESLGWEPRTRIEDGLHETVRWYCANR
jgi:dTDP-glucose 4,6-dehydratase